MAVVFEEEYNGDVYEVANMQEHERDEVVSIFFNAMAQGDGLSQREFESEQALIAYLQKGPVLILKRRPSPKILGVGTIRNSPLVRSTDTMYHAGYLILKKEERKKGLATLLVQRMHRKVSEKYGFVASVARTATVSKAVMVIARNKWTILGTIPNSTHFPQYGWVEDLICYSSTEAENEAVLPMFEDPREIPPLKGPDYQFLLNEDRLTKVYLPPLDFKGERMSVEFAGKADVIPVEEMIREAALEGLGFATDEFNSSGYMNRSLLLRSHMVVFKSPDKDIRAGIVFGPTAVCREKTTHQVGGYMVLHKSHRGMGLGGTITDYCLRNMSKLGYIAILTDVFACNMPALKMLQKRGFFATGTVPNSGIMYRHGRTNTYLMYKQVRNMKTAQL